MSDETPRDPNDRIDPSSVSPLRHRSPVVTDLRTVRRARARTSCRHFRSLIDERARVLECADCGSALDPFDVLAEMAELTDYERAFAEKERIEADVALLTTQLDQLRAKISSAKRDARKHDADTRTKFLRDALELLRARARGNHIDATYVAHLTTAVLKGHSITLADQTAGNASRIAQQNAKRMEKLGPSLKAVE